MVTNNKAALDNALTLLQKLWSSSQAPFMIEFQVRRQEKIIKEFRRHEPVRAFYLLGLAATLREDRKGMHGNFKNALIHSAYDIDVRHGYAACLSRMGMYADARKHYEIIHRKDPSDLSVLAELIISSLASGRVQDGVHWIGEWSKVNPNRPFQEAETIARSGALLERFGISDDHVERLQTLAMNILEKERKEIKTINYRGMPEEAPQWIDAQLVVDDSPEEVERLNGQLNRIMAGTSTPSRVADLLVFNFSTDEASGQ